MKMLKIANARLSFISLAFFVFPFTYFLQVVFKNELMGIIPYLLLALTLPKALKQWRANMRARHYNLPIDRIDVAIIALILLSTAHIATGYFSGNVALWDTLRCFVIYILSFWAYFYLRNVADISETRGILFAIICAAIIIGLHWVYATYTKMVLRDPGDFARMSYEYVKYRNGFIDDQVNVSHLRGEYRSYGLLEKHTSSGAIVAIGGIALLSILAAGRKLALSIVVICAFFSILSVGMATTAWASFLLIVPVLMFLADKERRWTAAAASAVSMLCVILIGAAILSQTNMGENMRQHIAQMGKVQLSYLLNFNISPDNKDVSFLSLYIREADALVAYFLEHPLYILVGEGFMGYAGVHYPRGGDVAFAELLITYGLPVSIFLLAIIFDSMRRSCLAIRSSTLSSETAALLIFSIGTLCFLLLSLSHYNTFFNKSFFILLPASLGIIRRYAGPDKQAL